MCRSKGCSQSIPPNHQPLLLYSPTCNKTPTHQIPPLPHQANIHSIMGSEEQVLHLMTSLDEGIEEAGRLKCKLDEYEAELAVGGCQWWLYGGCMVVV